MKQSRYFARITLGAAATVLLLFPAVINRPVSGYADNSLASVNNPAQTKPISKRRITLQLKFDDGRVASATELEGGMIRVESIKDNLVFGLIPLIGDDGQVQVKVFQLDPIKHQGNQIGESLTEIETLAINDAETRISNRIFNFVIRLTRIAESGPTEKKTL